MKENKNILQMVEHLLPGGAERMAVNISNLLFENGYTVVLCPTRAKGALESDVLPGVKLKCLNKQSFFDFIAFWKLFLIVKQDEIDIIHAHSSSVVWACFVKLLFPNVKIIWHDHYGSRQTDKKSNVVYRQLSPIISGIITVNDKLKIWSIQNMRIANKGNIVCLNNFPVLSSYYKKNRLNEINILLLSNLRKEKDHLNFLHAFASIKDKLESYNVKVFFAGMYWQDDYYKQLNDFIHENQISDYIQFLGSINNVSELLSNSDIGVICSVFEGLPVSLLEYGLAGLPVVVTNVGQCAEVVDNGNAGIVVPPSDPQALAEALLTYIHKPEMRESFGVKLKHRVESAYGAGKFMEEYKKLIESVNVR